MMSQITENTRGRRRPALKPIFAALLALATTSGYSQEKLDEYISEGLQNNLSILERNVSQAQAENALRTANGRFLPTVTLLGDYLSGEGGRNISLPLGDLMNPVYRSLNELTASDRFREVSNVTENFFPENFYDVRLRTSVPLLNTDLVQQRKVAGLNVALQQREGDAYRRQLIFAIKSAYYGYQAALIAIEVHEDALKLVAKNIELSESLLRHGKAVPAQLHRLRSEREEVIARITSARSEAEAARRSFNMLLNRDLGQEVIVDLPRGLPPPIDSAQVHAREREELTMMEISREMQAAVLRMAKLNRLPKISGFLDLGSQGSAWQFNASTRYYLVGVQVSIPVFQGSANELAIRRRALEMHKTDLQKEALRNRLLLAACNAADQAEAAAQNLAAAQKQLKAAQSYFNLTESGYRHGTQSLIELLDARNHLITSRLQVNRRYLEQMIALAALERETASYTLNR